MVFLDIRIEKTERAIKQAFMTLRAGKPLEKIKVKELCDLACINKSTFYAHYQDIYALLDAWFRERVASFLPAEELLEWKSATKTMLRQCREHPKVVYHLFDCLSRDRLERYIFTLTDDVFLRLVRQMAAPHRRPAW